MLSSRSRERNVRSNLGLNFFFARASENLLFFNANIWFATANHELANTNVLTKLSYLRVQLKPGYLSYNWNADVDLLTIKMIYAIISIQNLGPVPIFVIFRLKKTGIWIGSLLDTASYIRKFLNRNILGYWIKMAPHEFEDKWPMRKNMYR